MGRRSVSRGFICALIGVGMTLLAWYGPWEWPAWPAFTVTRLFFGSGESWLELPFTQRAAFLTFLILVNVSFWGGILFLLSGKRARGMLN